MLTVLIKKVNGSDSFYKDVSEVEEGIMNTLRVVSEGIVYLHNSTLIDSVIITGEYAEDEGT